MALITALRTQPDEWSLSAPDRVDIQCGWCGRAIAAERFGPAYTYGQPIYQAGSISAGIAALFVCPRDLCLRPSVLLFMVEREGGAGLLLFDVVEQHPRGRAEKMDGLPEAMQMDRLEAWSCFYGGDLRASVIMGRAAIQRAVRSLAATGGGLQAEINHLHETGKITKDLKEWADEVRIAGNDAAHPETLNEIDREDAAESLRFMEAFLESAIALPSRRDARSQARSQESA